MIDLFILHADVSAETAFVRDELVPALGLAGDQVLLSSELPLGKTIIGALEDGVASSRVTVAVLSPAFLSDKWAVVGEILGSTLAVTGGLLVPLVLVECELPLRLQARVQLDCRDPRRRPGEIARLRQLLAQHSPVTYDLFLAYPPAGRASVQALYRLLQPDVHAFLDCVSIAPGSGERGIATAQRGSRGTVILISIEIDAAWYLGDEIVTAIALHRAAPDSHELIPVLLEPGVSPPYGLSIVRTLDAVAVGGLDAVATQLRAIVTGLRRRLAAPPLLPERVAKRGRCDPLRLHERLLKVPDPLFETILLHAKVDRSLIHPATTPIAARALDVAQLAALNQDLCARLATQLDLRAPSIR